MKARLSIVICVAALFLLSVSFAYAQQMDSSVFIPAAFVPVVPQMGAEIPISLAEELAQIAKGNGLGAGEKDARP